MEEETEKEKVEERERLRGIHTRSKDSLSTGQQVMGTKMVEVAEQRTMNAQWCCLVHWFAKCTSFGKQTWLSRGSGHGVCWLGFLFFFFFLRSEH